MALPVSEELMKDLAVMVLNYTKICKHFGLTDEQMRSINAGDWIIETNKQYTTAFLLNKATPIEKDTEPEMPQVTPAIDNTPLSIDNNS